MLLPCMLRICRENALRMMKWAFADAADDDKHAHIAYDLHPKENWKRLKKDAQKLLRATKLGLDVKTMDRLKQAVETAESNLGEADSIKLSTPIKYQHENFTTMATVSGQQLRAFGVEPSVIVLQILDYWFEC